ncbi:hypothetical protein E5288_WYG022854 [Bos mutus]|uniref:40S ribosomal protein SA C-terminal domain-containing protein n=1 Tax=Bos mutus TaxID=72004 RepID=L8HLU6_9CETA|nr:hypothetical protein M91_21694 [Bos mutus]MXQ96378.1 hypothetical protein [Bos mutus]
MKDDTITFLAAGAHLGITDFYFPVEQYIYRRKTDGVYIRNPKRTWEKLLNLCQRAELQFAATASLVGYFAPGASTNQTQAASRSQDS